MTLRFHWRLPLAGEEPGATVVPPCGTPATALPDLAAQARFCRLAEECGIESLLMACGYYMPDPIPLVAALGTTTEKIGFMLAYRPGLLSPTVFVQQVNTLSVLNGGRLSLNVVIGHSQEEQRAYGDFLSHDERYRRADEFLSICHGLWCRDVGVDFDGKYYRIADSKLKTPFLSSSAERRGPEVYLSGGSPPAMDNAAKHADCWLRLADAPEKVRPQIEAMRARGVEVGLRMSVIARPTREEAIQAAYALAEKGDTDWVREVFVKGSDSASIQASFAQATDDAQWPTPYLWTGAVAGRGPSAVCLVGSADDVACGIMEYRGLGVSQFILSGWPNTEAVTYFGREILPRVRAREAAT